METDRDSAIEAIAAELNLRAERGLRFAELTKGRVSKQPTGDPNHLVVPFDSDYLFACPYLHIEDAGTLRFSEAEVERVREYLLKGGFIWADDSWGDYAIQSWTTFPP